MASHLIFIPSFKKNTLVSGLVALALYVSAGVANAASITYQSATGTWTSYIADTTYSPSYASDFIQGIGSSAVYWGQPFYDSNDPQKSMIFQGNTSSLLITPGSTAFTVGWLTHSNNAIYGDTNITTATLGFQLILNGSNTFNFNYNFNIFQDANDNYADTLTVTNVGSTQFTLGGQSYLFNLLGFYQGGTINSGVKVSDAGTANQIPVYASITPITTAAPIPIPAALWLLGSALLGLAGFTKRREII